MSHGEGLRRYNAALAPLHVLKDKKDVLDARQSRVNEASSA
jgi:hypothetical protein